MCLCLRKWDRGCWRTSIISPFDPYREPLGIGVHGQCVYIYDTSIWIHVCIYSIEHQQKHTHYRIQCRHIDSQTEPMRNPMISKWTDGHHPFLGYPPGNDDGPKSPGVPSRTWPKDKACGHSAGSLRDSDKTIKESPHWMHSAVLLIHPDYHLEVYTTQRSTITYIRYFFEEHIDFLFNKCIQLYHVHVCPSFHTKPGSWYHEKSKVSGWPLWSEALP